MSTHPSSPGQVAADKLELISTRTLDMCESGLGMIEATLSKSFFREGAHLTHLADTLQRLHDERATLRRSQPVFSLEQIARKATKSAWRSVNRRIISFDSFKASVEPVILRACQAAASQARL